MKQLLLLMIFASSLSFSMDDNELGQKRNATEELSKRDKKRQKREFYSRCNRAVFEDGLECGKEFNDQLDDFNHKFSQHIIREKSCPACNQHFRVMETLIQHMKNCPQDNEGKAKKLLKNIADYQGPEKCKDCGKVFSEFTHKTVSRHDSNCKKNKRLMVQHQRRDDTNANLNIAADLLNLLKQTSAVKNSKTESEAKFDTEMTDGKSRIAAAAKAAVAACVGSRDNVKHGSPIDDLVDASIKARNTEQRTRASEIAQVEVKEFSEKAQSIKTISFNNPSHEEMDYYFKITQPYIVDDFVSAVLNYNEQAIHKTRCLLVMGDKQKSTKFGITPLEAAQKMGLTKYLEQTRMQLASWEEYVNATQPYITVEYIDAIMKKDFAKMKSLKVVFRS